MIESGWTVQVTRDKVGAFKEAGEPPAWADSGRIAEALLNGQMKINEVAKLQKLVDKQLLEPRRFRPSEPHRQEEKSVAG